MGVGDDVVVHHAHAGQQGLGAKAVIDLPRLGGAVAGGVLAKHAPLGRGAVEQPQLGQHGCATHVLSGLGGRRKVQILVLHINAEVVDAQPGRNRPIAQHGFVLHKQARAGFMGIREAFERENFWGQGGLAGVQVADAVAHPIQPIDKAG